MDRSVLGERDSLLPGSGWGESRSSAWARVRRWPVRPRPPRSNVGGPARMPWRPLTYRAVASAMGGPGYHIPGLPLRVDLLLRPIPIVAELAAAASYKRRRSRSIGAVVLLAAPLVAGDCRGAPAPCCFNVRFRVTGSTPTTRAFTRAESTALQRQASSTTSTGDWSTSSSRRPTPRSALLPM